MITGYDDLGQGRTAVVAGLPGRVVDFLVDRGDDFFSVDDARAAHGDLAWSRGTRAIAGGFRGREGCALSPVEHMAVVGGEDDRATRRGAPRRGQGAGT